MFYIMFHIILIKPSRICFSLLRKVLEKSYFISIEELKIIVDNFKNNLMSYKLNNIFNHAFKLFNLL